MQTLTNKRILLGVTGGIAAYKAAELLRRLQDHGADVRVVMTRGATEFITPLTMQALSDHPVHLELLDPETESAMGHIELARWADLILVAPASADFIARLAQGRGDDLLTTVCLAAECRIAVAPAMNQAMWANPATRENCALLEARKIELIGPEEGIQACGETGAGRLMAVERIIVEVENLFATGLLSGKRVMITAGPTREAIDPVRYISNHSSGKQGYALAVAAVEAGACVTLISGPTHLAPPERMEVVPVISARDMFDAVMSRLPGTDIFIGVAAVADYRPVDEKTHKIKKRASAGQKLVLELVENPDIIAAVSSSADRPFTVGFAAETRDLLDHAAEKLDRKNLDMIIANHVGEGDSAFNADDNELTVISRDGSLTLPRMSKSGASVRIIELIARQLNTDRI